MTIVTRTISALRAIFLPLRLAKNLSHPMRMRTTGSINVKFSAASAEGARGVYCKSLTTTLSRCAIALMATISLAHAVDSDADGLDDSVKTNTGVYVSASNTGTNPTKADTDGDGLPDGLEVKEKTSPLDATKFNSYSKGLVGYWSLDSSFADTSGNQIDLVNTPSTQFISGRNGRSNECLNFTTISGCATSVKPITISGNQNRTISYRCYITQNDIKHQYSEIEIKVLQGLLKLSHDFT